MLVSQMLKATNGKLLSGDPEISIKPSSISIDSRTIKKGDFFLPLKGNNFDGEKFISEALKKGAKGVFVTRSPGHQVTRSQEKIIIQVKDTTDALQRIAQYHRMEFDIPVIGVTGSNGKTTTKEMISQVLSKKFNVLKNEGTKNNHIGVPQTLLKLSRKHDICALEMGANHKGEIRLLADIARPNIAVITNIGPSHLKFLKCLKGVSQAKKEILEFLGRDGLVIVNGDDEHLSALNSRSFKIIKIGFDQRNDLRASLVSTGMNRVDFLLNDKERITLRLIGTHNVYNALAAIAVARHLKMSIASIKEGLFRYRPTHMRLNIKNIGGMIVVDDAYNSNPSSMKCALQAMKGLKADAKWVVSADMLELGREEDYFHRMVGESVARSGFKGLITFGRLSKYTHLGALECGMNGRNTWHCSTHGQIAGILRKVAKRGDAILVKGSRAMKMEKVIDGLKF